MSSCQTILLTLQPPRKVEYIFVVYHPHILTPFNRRPCWRLIWAGPSVFFFLILQLVCLVQAFLRNFLQPIMFVFADCRLLCEDRGYYFVRYECEDDLEEYYYYLRLDDGASLVLRGSEWSGHVRAEGSDALARTFDSVVVFKEWLDSLVN